MNNMETTTEIKERNTEQAEPENLPDDADAAAVHQIYKQPFLLIRCNYRALISFEVRYKIFVMIIVFPLLSYTLRLLLIVNRKSNIAMYNAPDMLKNPLSWVVLLVMGVLMSIFTAAEQFGIIRILSASVFRRKTDVRTVFKETFDIVAEQFRWQNLLILPYFLIVFPIAMSFDNSSVTKFITIPGFILEHFTKYRVFKYGFFIMRLILSVLSLYIIYSTTAMKIKGKDFPSACRESIKLSKLKRLCILIVKILKILILYSILCILFATVILALIIAGIHWLEPGFDLSSLMNEEFGMMYVLAAGTIASWIFIAFIQAVVVADYYEFTLADTGVIPPYRETSHISGRPVFRYLFAAGCAVLLFFSVPVRYRQFKSILSGNTTGIMVMAHRGYSEAAPENTMPAFVKAYEAGVNAVELDVQMTKDGEIIVLHDYNLKRTTGLDKNVWEVTYDEIKDLDNGSFFSEEYKGTVIPTLDEVIRYCKGRMFINIEIKRNRHDEGIEDRVVEIIRRNGFSAECDITSQDYETLQYIRKKYPDILLAYTSVIGIGDVQNLEACDILSIQETFATFDTVEALHQQGKRVFVWTVNEEGTMERLIGLNVDAILTNNPDLALKVVGRHKGFEDFYKRLNQVMIYLN